MNKLLADSIYFGMTVSIIGYGIGLLIQKKLKNGLFNPLLISIIFVIAVIKIFDIQYQTYDETAKYLSYLLTPATVALAIPLYQKISLLKENPLAVGLSIVAGVFSSMGSVFLLSWMFQLSHEQYVSLLPKSITTAIGMGISEELGGIVAISVAAITITGILGNVIAEVVCKIFRITEPIAKGLAIGTASHAAGTSKALEIGEVEGAMSSLSIAVSGLLTVVFASVFATLL